jgi:hypothetical protein
MKLYTLWQSDGNEATMPWLVAACDEYSMMECNGYPEEYAKRKKKDPRLRELVIEIPEKAVGDLFFRTPMVEGKMIS